MNVLEFRNYWFSVSIKRMDTLFSTKRVAVLNQSRGLIFGIFCILSMNLNFIEVLEYYVHTEFSTIICCGNSYPEDSDLYRLFVIGHFSWYLLKSGYF